MSRSMAFPITKGSDRDYFESLRVISQTETAKQLGLSQFIATSVLPDVKFEFGSIDAAAQDSDLNRLLDSSGRALKTLTLKGGKHSIGFQRTDDFEHGKVTGLEDSFRLSLHQQASETELKLGAQLVADIQNATKSFSICNLQGLMGEQATANLAARQEALTKLETMHASMLHDFMKQKAALDEAMLKREDALQTSYQARQEELEKLYTERHSELATRENQLTARQQDLDDRSSTHVRRELRKNLKEILVSRQSSFVLSKDTKHRRRFVFWGYSALLTLFAIPAGYLLYQESLAESFNPWTFGRQVAFSVAFIFTAGFFLRWLNTWAQQHAEEEFKLKQLELDIDRASWVVEMALEWKAAKGDDLPIQLADRLSANLFSSPANGKNDSPTVTASDAIVQALLQTSSNVELAFPGGRISLDRKSLKKANEVSP